MSIRTYISHLRNTGLRRKTTEAGSGNNPFSALIRAAVMGTFVIATTISCNKYVTFTDSFVAFDSTKSSVVSVDAEGEFTGSYVVHLTGEKPDSPVTVSFEVTCGDGLKEGVDFEVATSGGKITFLPGIYDNSIKINWLPHDIDASKDNTVTISLVDAGGVTLGMPGPDKSMKNITIRKYSTK